MTTPSNRPIPSNLPQDLLFNAEKLDEGVNSSQQTYVDRLGVSRLTAQGAIDSFRAINPRGPWASGSVYAARDVVTNGGSWYIALDGHTAGGSFAGDATHWRPWQLTDGSVSILVGNGVTDNSAALSAAVAVGRTIAIIGMLHVASPTTITVPLLDSTSQLFSNTSQVTINNGRVVRAEWFGTSTGYGDRAVAALPASGGTVEFSVNSSSKAFDHAYNAGYLSKPNVTLRGKKMPQLATDCRSLTGGTILRGMLQVYADNFEIREIGVDMGKTTSEQLYGGAQAVGITEGLVITYPSDALKSSSPLKRGVKLHNVIGLGPDPASPTHAIIMGEGVTDVTTTGQVIGAMALHPLVFKCANVNANELEGYLGNGEGLIIKSDTQPTAISRDIQIKSVVLSAQGPTGVTPFTGSIAAVGLQIQAQAGAIDKIQIGQAKIVGYPKCANASFGGAYGIISVSIDSLLTDCFGVAGTTYGIDLTSTAGQNIQQWTIGTLEARNCTAAGHFAFSQTADLKNHLSIGRLYAKNCNFALDIGGQSYVDIGTVVTDTCTDAVYRITGTPKLTVGQLFKDTATPAVYSSTSGGLVPSIGATWTQVASNDPFGVDLLGGRVNLRGLIKPSGSPTTTCAVLPLWARPLTVKRFLAQGWGGSGQVAVPVTIDTSGNVNVNEVAGGTANCTNWLSLSGISFDTQA